MGQLRCAYSFGIPQLGDRIAIMAHGRLRAIGNSISLKNKYGAGYRISIVTDPTRVSETKSVVSSRVPGVILEDDSAGALIYQFPISSTSAIPDFVIQHHQASAPLRLEYHRLER